MREAEQQPGGKLEQLDVEAEAVVDPVATDWTHPKVGPEVG